MSICQATHFELLVEISVIWRQRRASEAGIKLMGICHGRCLSVFPSLSLPCYPSRRRLSLRTSSMALVPPYPSLLCPLTLGVFPTPPISLESYCTRNLAPIHVALLMIGVSKPLCMGYLFPSTLGMAPGAVLTPGRSSSSCTRLALPQPLVAFMSRVSSMWNVPQA